MVFPESLYRQF